MPFVEIEHNVDEFGFVVNVLARNGGKVDVALRAVDLLEVFKSLPDQLAVEHLAQLHSEDSQKDFLLEQSIARKVHLSDAVLVSFLQVNVDKDALGLVRLEGDGKKGNARYIADINFGFLDKQLDVTFFVVLGANSQFQ